jgi:flagellar FliJ protein
MKPFRLQSVLDYRKQIENMAQKSLLMCLEQKHLLILKKEEEQKKLQKLYDGFQESKHKGMLITEINLYVECIGCKKNQIQDIIRQLDRLEQKIKEKQKQLVHARQEKKTLEILKENRKNVEEQRQKRLENVFLDEVAMLCFGDRK